MSLWDESLISEKSANTANKELVLSGSFIYKESLFMAEIKKLLKETKLYQAVSIVIDLENPGRFAKKGSFIKNAIKSVLKVI